MPPELTPYLPQIFSVSTGLFFGWLFTRLMVSGKIATLMERHKAEVRRGLEMEARLAHATEESEQNELEAQTFRNQLTEARARLDGEITASAEKQALLERAEIKLSNTFKALSADALRLSSEQFLRLAKSSLATQTEQAKGDIEKRKIAIETLISPVAQSLGKFEHHIGELEKTRETAYTELRQQIRALGEGQIGLQRETASLVKALRRPTGRGQWGEMQLQRVVELAGMQEHCDFEIHHTTTNDEGKKLRPDLIIHLPGGRLIVVDSKTPMDAYLDAIEANDDATREEALLRHARQVRTHIQQLSSKNYTAQFEQSPEFTVLFLPSESFFSAALQVDSSLIERGVDHGIILATPTTLIALLRAVSYGWRQDSLADNAREISTLGRVLHERLGKLSDHFTKLGRSLENAVDQYNSAIGSYETRVLTTARKFEDLKTAPEGTTLNNLELIHKTPRHLTPLSAPPISHGSFVEHIPLFTPEPEAFALDPQAATDLLEPPIHADDDFTFMLEPPAQARRDSRDF